MAIDPVTGEPRWRADGGEELVARVVAGAFALALVASAVLGVAAALRGERAVADHRARLERAPGEVVQVWSNGRSGLVQVEPRAGARFPAQRFPVDDPDDYRAGELVEVRNDPLDAAGPYLAGEDCDCPQPVWPVILGLFVPGAILGWSVVVPAWARRRRIDALIDGPGPTRPFEAWWQGPEQSLLVLHDPARRVALASVATSPLARSVVRDGDVVHLHGPYVAGAEVGLSGGGTRVRPGPLGSASVRVVWGGMAGGGSSGEHTVEECRPLEIDPTPDGSTPRRRLAMALTSGLAMVGVPLMAGVAGLVALTEAAPGGSAARLVVLAFLVVGGLWAIGRMVTVVDATLRTRRRFAALADPGAGAGTAVAPPQAPTLGELAELGAIATGDGGDLVLFVEGDPSTPIISDKADGWWFGSRLSAGLVGLVVALWCAFVPPVALFVAAALVHDGLRRVRGRRVRYRRPALGWWSALAATTAGVIVWTAGFPSDGTSSSSVAKAVVLVAIWPFLLLAWRLVRAGLVIGSDVVRVRNVFTTVDVPADRVVAVEHPPSPRRLPRAGLLVRCADGTEVRASRFAVSWFVARRAVAEEADHWPSAPTGAVDAVAMGR